MNENSDKPSNAFRIDPYTTVGAVTIGVRELDKLVQFYQEIIGLSVIKHTSVTVELGIGKTTLVILEARPDGKQFPRSPGLYHMAILLPSREVLGHWLNHLVETRYPLSGAGDHLVSEALYLSDPEGNGIEIYRDRPREEWEETENGIRMDTLPVDLESLRAETSTGEFSGLPNGTAMGHVHLKVNDIKEAIEFYHEILGFDLMASLPGAAFLSAGGYHHHIGSNVWNSRGAAPPPPGSLGLIAYQINLPNEEALHQLLNRLDAEQYAIERNGTDPFLRDPAGNGILLRVKV